MAMEKGLPIPLGIAIGLARRTAVRFGERLLITRLKIAPFIVTLGTLGIFRGFTLMSSNGLPVHQIPAEFSFLGEGNLLGVPFVLWLLVFAPSRCTSCWSTHAWAGMPSRSEAIRPPLSMLASPLRFYTDGGLRHWWLAHRARGDD